MNKLSELKKLSEAGTGGPWGYHNYGDCEIYPHVMYYKESSKYNPSTGDTYQYTKELQICTPPHNNVMTESNMKLIASMRNHFDALIAVAECAEAYYFEGHHEGCTQKPVSGYENCPCGYLGIKKALKNLEEII